MISKLSQDETCRLDIRERQTMKDIQRRKVHINAENCTAMQNTACMCRPQLGVQTHPVKIWSSSRDTRGGMRHLMQNLPPIKESGVMRLLQRIFNISMSIPSRIQTWVREDYKDTALTTQPPRLDVNRRMPSNFRVVIGVEIPPIRDHSQITKHKEGDLM